jgi:hypothetical protein
MTTSESLARRSLTPEERIYLQKALADEREGGTVVRFFLFLIFMAVLLAIFVGPNGSRDFWSYVIFAWLAIGWGMLLRVFFRRRAADELENADVVTISGKLTHREDSNEADVEGAIPKTADSSQLDETFFENPHKTPITAIGSYPIRFPSHWDKDYPSGRKLIVEAFPFPEFFWYDYPEKRSFFVLTVKGERSVSREVSAGLLKMRPEGRRVVSFVLWLFVCAAFCAVASTDFFSSIRYPLNFYRNDLGQRHDFESVAAVLADKPGVGRYLRIASGWINPSNCLVDVGLKDIESFKASRKRFAARVAEINEVKHSIAEPHPMPSALDEKTKTQLENSILGIMVLEKARMLGRAEAGPPSDKVTTEDVRRAAVEVLSDIISQKNTTLDSEEDVGIEQKKRIDPLTLRLAYKELCESFPSGIFDVFGNGCRLGNIVGQENQAMDPIAEMRALARICDTVRQDIYDLFGTQCGRGLSVVGARGSSSMFCYVSEDISSGRAERALSAIEEDMHRSRSYEGIVTSPSEYDAQGFVISLAQRHQEPWPQAGAAVYGSIVLVLSVLLFRALTPIKNAAIKRRLRKLKL